MNISRRSKGTTNNMLEAMKRTLEDHSVEQSTTVSAASDIDVEYIAQVEQSVVNKVMYETDDITFQETDNAIYCTVAYDDYITNFEIPYDDLYMNDVELDANYIANFILDSIDEALEYRDYD